ncbi:MAG: DUF418 domain-containing protein, partial [Terriglobales bacterium]
YRELVAHTAQQFARRHFSFADFPWRIPYLGWIGEEFPLLLLGLYAGRRRIFENIPAHLPFIRKVMWWGLGLGLVGNLVWVVTSEMSNPAWPYLTRQVGGLFEHVVGKPALCFFYASVIILLAQQEVWKTRLAALAPVGRIALSNYLFQILVFAMILYSYGLGLYGKVGPAMGVALTLLIFAVQVLLSVWWVRRFRFGPAEWLWRTLTYGKLQPMRLTAAPAAA